MTVPLSGCGGGSTTTTAATSAVAPGAPAIGAATAGSGSASIAFTAPASTGGATITGYTATCTASGNSISGTGTASPISVTGLTNGTTYGCTVTATNSAGVGPASASVSVTPAGAAGVSTAAVDCPYSENTFNSSISLTSTASWTCSSTRRSLTANGIPDHAVGTFPNANNPNSIAVQSVSFSATLTPAAASSTNTDAMQLGYARNGVKFDPGTAGTCPSGATATTQCSLIGNSGTFRIEALGQTTFNFGTDTNNAHVQPGGAYHYHGMPEGLLTAAGSTTDAPKMVLIGYAPDGYPVYARWGRTTATDGGSALKVMRGSYGLKTTLDSGRPATSIVPAGVFLQDYQYTAGSGDLDECNGRFDVTPEFPAGIYHYYATDTYPYLPRCWKGVIS